MTTLLTILLSLIATAIATLIAAAAIAGVGFALWLIACAAYGATA